jgi:hypothetical protein
MKFQVPQFIEMEDKIFGPLSFKEFIYIIGGCGLSFLIYRFIPFFYLAVLLIIPVMAFSIALAFYKPNNKPFIEMVESAAIFFVGSKLYTWKKTNKPVHTKTVDLDNIEMPHSLIHTSMPAITEGKISNTSRELELEDNEQQTKQDINSKLNIKI